MHAIRLATALAWLLLGLLPISPLLGQEQDPRKRKGPVKPTREEAEAQKKEPFFAVIESKKAVVPLGGMMDVRFKIRNNRAKKFKVVVSELSYLAVRFEIAYGDRKPFVYGRFVGSDTAPSRARFFRLTTGKTEKARFKIPAVLSGPVKLTALYPTEDGKVHRSNTIELFVAGEDPLRVVLKVESRGRVVMRFFPEQAPNSVTHFIERVLGEYYDGLVFHRVVPDFVAQTGCPTGRGNGGPGYTVKGEFEGEKKHVRGAIGMARTKTPDSNGSQFYFCLTTRKCAGLTGKYTVFGEVEDGMKVVDAVKQGDAIDTMKILKPGKRGK